ncbi:MAG TPA: hypothetical protein VFX17_00310 [Patescibacteria group bacterium]|nr:hypothetical protein [Patescibacteria group bacterium]
MKKLIYIILILGFLFLDFLLFHDILKPGETYTVADFLTGVLSILVIIVSVKALLVRDNHQANDQA